MTLGTEVGLGSAHRRCVRWGTNSPSLKGERPQFSAHVYSGQTAIWMKMPLGTEGDLSPGHIMLDGDPAPPCEMGTASPRLPAHVYCDHGRLSQLLLSSCTNGRPETLCCVRVKVSPHILALLFDLPSVLRDNSLLITEHFQTETVNASIRATTTSFSAAVAFRL